MEEKKLNIEQPEDGMPYVQKVMPPAQVTPFGIRRKLIAHKTTEVWQKVPHAGYTMECDITDFLRELDALNASGRHPKKIKLNTALLRVLIEGVFAAPQVNAHLDYDHKLKLGKVKQFEQIDINMPWLSNDGKLIVVKLPDFGRKSLDEMTDYIENLRERVDRTNVAKALIEISLRDTKDLLKQRKYKEYFNRARGAMKAKKAPRPPADKVSKKQFEELAFEERLNYKDLDYGTILFSNVGYSTIGVNGTVTLMDIGYPQVFACAIGGIQEKPWVFVNGQGEKEIGIRKVMPFCITFDHRAYDFGDIAPFIRRVNEVFVSPSMLHSW
ncbi:MAG: 2-oxo acid dehydrogenase subunit E2 [Oscillospiraceae bacterium]|nr:2-oxo acid dehydrogenase subunit E2 [Oscillospiraceae bacterium]